jgi:hypothetical protein
VAERRREVYDVYMLRLGEVIWGGDRVMSLGVGRVAVVASEYESDVPVTILKFTFMHR